MIPLHKPPALRFKSGVALFVILITVVGNFFRNAQLERNFRGITTEVNDLANSSSRITLTALTSSKLSSAMHVTPLSQHEHCAIMFFGLPRAFESLVLPSIKKNIIPYNPDCDYYVHFYNRTKEDSGRKNMGGIIDPTEIFKLKDAVLQGAQRRRVPLLPRVEFKSNSEEEFWVLYADLLEKTHSAKDEKGRYLYFPWKDKSYTYPTSTDNIIKMWHSIQSAFQLMERNAAALGIKYNTVAMLRSDVVYVTPINISDTILADSKSGPVTIPSFGKYPVSDRMIYGPADAVKIWATERFSRLEQHVHYTFNNTPGYGMHSERFVNNTLLPAIREREHDILQHPTLCFLRARADESVMVSDCGGAPRISEPSIMKSLGTDMKIVVEETIGRKCNAGVKIKSFDYHTLECSSGDTTE